MKNERVRSRDHFSPSTWNASFAIDCASFVPDLIRDSNSAVFAKLFAVCNGLAEVTDRDDDDADLGLVIGNFGFPETADGQATGSLVFVWPHWTEARMILVVGDPAYRGTSYYWNGICPKTFQHEQMLFFDPANQMFLSKRMVGKAPPKAIARREDLDAILKKIATKYGGIDTVSGKELPDIATDADFAPYRSVLEILIERLCSVSGLPPLIISYDNSVDIASMRQTWNSHHRLSQELLQRPLTRLVRQPRSREEFEQMLRGRGLPVPRPEDWPTSDRATRGRRK